MVDCRAGSTTPFEWSPPVFAALSFQNCHTQNSHQFHNATLISTQAPVPCLNVKCTDIHWQIYVTCAPPFFIFGEGCYLIEGLFVWGQVWEQCGGAGGGLRTEEMRTLRGELLISGQGPISLSLIPHFTMLWEIFRKAFFIYFVYIHSKHLWQFYLFVPNMSH